MINIKGVQIADGESDTTELFTHGTFYKKNNIYYLSYDESESTGYEDCHTTLKVENENKVSLIRHGKYRTNLTIERGTRHVGWYDTIQGQLLIGVQTSEIDVNIDDNGGSLYFKYALDINTSLISENKVYVNVSEPSPLQ